jgi:hypothetical protein
VLPPRPFCNVSDGSGITSGHVDGGGSDTGW